MGEGNKGARREDAARGPRGRICRAREGAREAEVVVREPSPLARFMLELDEQCPILKFLGFGCYYAWIWLSYNSTVLIGSSVPTQQGADTVFMMYLLSTTALALMLILAAVFPRWSARVVESRAAVFAASVAAAVSTVCVMRGSSGGAAGALFLVASVLTGLGTAWVCLRLGAVYATVSARRASLYAATSMCLACLLYFLAAGLPRDVGIVIMACLPVAAALCTMTTSEEPVVQAERPQRSQALPKGFFLRLVLAIAVVSTVVGVTRGFSTLTQTVSTLDEQGVLIVFGTACVALAFYVLVSSLGNDFDISRLYYPAIILVVAGISVMPLVGGGSLGGSLFENHFVNIAYACFVMMVWCLCAHVSYMSGLSPVRVYGLGRGASALGTTVGWLLGSQLIGLQDDNPLLIVVVSMLMVLALLVVSMLVLNDRTIGTVLRSASKGSPAADGRDEDAALSLAEGFDAGDATGVADGPSCVAADGAPTHKLGAFTKRCRAVADACGLSQRERDVLFLLAKGRTINFVAEELGVSFNTAKSHIRHVYVKTGVHTRQDLLDLIEGVELED